MKHLGILLATVGSAVVATPASAALLTFTVTGGTNLVFQLDSNPTPSRILANSFVLYEASGDYRFYNTATLGGFQLQNGNTQIISTTGPQLFTGTLAEPQFLTGNFTLRDANGTSLYSLNISPAAGVVPEPATWAMMIGGFGVVGFAMRRRRNVTTAVSLA